jgi:multiple sugar transport system substrate-binding protein
MANKTFNRRDFLRMGALTAAGAALASCTTPTPETVTVKETVVVKEEGETVVEVETVKETVVVEATPLPAEAQTAIIFVGFGTGTAAEQIEVHEAIAEEYNAQSDFHQVEFLTVPYAENQAKFSTMLAAGMPPDVCMPIGVSGIARNFDAWDDLTPWIERDNYDLSGFSGLAVELHKYPEKGQLGLPVGMYPTVIFYNEDLFDAAGVDYPPHDHEAAYADGDPWTYDKMVEVAKQLTIDANGNNADSPAFDWESTVQWGWNGWDWMHPRAWVGKFGGRTTGVSEDGKTALFNSQGWVDCFTFAKDVIWTDHVRATGEQAGAFYDVAGDPMGSGMVGMWECHSWMAWAYGSWTEAFNWNIAANPNVEGLPIVAPMHADTFVMLKTAPHKDAAWDAIKWMFTPDILNRLCKNWGAIPAHLELGAGWVDDMKADYPDVDFEVFIKSADYLEMPNHESWTPDYGRVFDGVQTTWDLIGTGENLNVQEVLDSYQAEAQGYLDEWWEIWG